MKKISLLLLILIVQIASAKRPVIGLSCSWSATEVKVSNTYITSVIKAGGVPVIIPLTDDTTLLAEQVANLDAVIMIGGEDYDPLLFGQEPARALGGVVPERDSYDLTLIREAANQGKPLLGICRGLQGINVAFGGTLIQDIPSTGLEVKIQHLQSRSGKFGSHTINVDENSLLYNILGTKEVSVNSFHHQAIDRLAEGFKVSARAKDGIIEAIEKTDGKAMILAVQFHPEAMTAGGDEQMLKIFDYFIKQAQK